MSDSKQIELDANDQDEVEYEVADNTDVLLVSLKSDEHQDVTTYPTWYIEDEDFPEGEQGVGEYPARLEPLGDRLVLKVRNEHEQKGTTVTVGFREKKLVTA